MTKGKSKFNPRKQKQLIRSLIPFTMVVVVISGLIAYLWISSEVDETLNELEIQQSIVVELNDDINILKDDIEYFRMLSRRRVNSAEDEIINCTSLPEKKLREAFREIRQISYDRYHSLDWDY